MRLDKWTKMGLLPLLLGGVFLWNPIIASVDVLPDAVGYLFLSLGLLRMADLNDRIRDAAKRFRSMIWICVGELLAVYLLYGVLPEQELEMNRYEMPVWILVCSFAAAFLRIYFLLPAFRDLFLGLDRISERFGAVGLARVTHGKTRADRLRSATARFVVCSAVLAVLPELTILTSFEADLKDRIWFNWYAYVDLFRTVCGGLCFLIGLIWLIGYIRYMAALCKETCIVDGLEAAYAKEILPQTSMLTVRRFSTAFGLLNVAVLFFANVRINHYTVLPGFVLAVLFMSALLWLGNLIGNRRRALLPYMPLAVISLVQVLVRAAYLRRYLPEASMYQGDAYRHFLLVQTLEAAEAICAVLALGAILWTLYHSVVLQHTEVVYTRGMGHREISEYATRQLHDGFKKRLTVIFVLACAAGAVNLLDAFLQLQFPWLWLLSFALSFAVIWLFYSVLCELSLQIQAKYGSNGAYKAN